MSMSARSTRSSHATAFRRTPLSLALLAALGLGACGGGGSGGEAPPAGSSESAANVAVSFPSGLSVGSPAALSTSTSTVAAAPAFDGLRYAADWARAARTAWQLGDTRTLARLATGLVPAPTAQAAPAVEPDLKAGAATLDKVLTGDTTVPLASVLDMAKLFSASNNANCYGPSVAYSSHQDGSPAAGTLPGGDLGLWTATEGASQPCIAAQINARVSGVKARTRQGLLLAAVMRATVARNSLTLPSAGASLDIQTQLQTALAAVPAMSGLTVGAATVALNGAGTEYTYRLVVNHGSGASAKTGEVVLRHTPGASASAYTGVMQVAGFELNNDAAFGCSDQIDSTTSRYKVARVSSLKYSRSGTAVAFSSRDGQYCGHAASTASAHYAADVASFASDGQLNAAVKITGSTRGGTLGWRGSFTRFAGDFDRVTVAGNFLSVWQAGTGDDRARALAAHADYNTASEVRTLTGHFAFTNEISTTDGSLLGMVCNWAGPGNNHTPGARFQTQTATLAPSATEYTLGTSLITYAPTTSCTSTTTAYDVNVDATIASGEGVGTAVALDVPTGTNTVQQEINARGYAKPSLF